MLKWFGLARGALEKAINYTQQRKQFGWTIADFQGVQFQLAEAAINLEAAQLSVYNVARLREAGQHFETEAEMCKLSSSNMARALHH